jgi:hypothetical protein
MYVKAHNVDGVPLRRREAMPMTKKAVHVMYSMAGWVVKIDDVKGLTLHNTKADAIASAEFHTKALKLELVIHAKDGSLPQLHTQEKPQS